jgi:hypothetical protein
MDRIGEGVNMVHHTQTFYDNQIIHQYINRFGISKTKI